MASGYQFKRRKAGVLGMCSALATVLLHGLIAGALLWGDGQHLKRKPDLSGAGANAADSGAEVVSVLFFIDEPSAPRSPDEDAQPLSSGGAPKLASLVKIAAPDPLPPPPLIASDDGDRTDVTAESDSDAASRALLFGRYEGQIKARIERAWLRPRSPIGEDSFQCHVKVLQDKQGTVLEVDLVRCNGTPRWQLSLAAAIQSASPLPAPPNPAVFSEALTLTFSARAFLAGRDEQGYESPAALIAQTQAPGIGATPGNTPPTTASTPIFRRYPKSDVMELRITGTTATTERLDRPDLNARPPAADLNIGASTTFYTEAVEALIK